MIQILSPPKEVPYQRFITAYQDAVNANQKNIEAVSISSFSKENNEVDSRFVNLKMLTNKNFIFFSNYKSTKAQQFNGHNQVSVLIYWNSINLQIRMKGKIKKTTSMFNDDYFSNRSVYKNALAISSNQSQKIDSYEGVVEKYNAALKTKNLKVCPEYWGGFKIKPYYFEFWEGHDSRLNKREVYEKSDDNWKHLILQP